MSDFFGIIMIVQYFLIYTLLVFILGVKHGRRNLD